MYFVSFETSTKIFSLAVNKDEKVLRYRNLKSAFLLENSIVPALDKMLDSVGIKFSQLDGFAIALGPGSFTSLRVGLSMVKAFAMATGRPVVGIPTLDINIPYYLLGKPEFRIKYGPLIPDEICVINDARRGNVYACIYGPKGRKTGYLLTTLENVLDKVHGRTLFTGDGLSLYRKNIEEAYRKYASKKESSCKCLFAEEKYWYPQAKVMAALAYERFRNKQYDDAASLVPLYLYPQDCQVSLSHGR
jgi:tRNA threonylcarbamoyladenosine biosynthesis protein TsaB